MGLPRPNTLLLLAALFVGTVASAQFARAFWGFYKPGGKKLGLLGRQRS